MSHDTNGSSQSSGQVFTPASPTQPASASAREGEVRWLVEALEDLKYIEDHTKYLSSIPPRKFDRIRAALSAPRAPSIEPVAWVIDGTAFDTEGNKLVEREIDYDQEAVDSLPIGTKLYAAPTGAGVEEFPLPELPEFGVRECIGGHLVQGFSVEQYREGQRAALRSYSASLGRTEGKV